MKVFRWAFIGAGTLGKQVAKQITGSGRHKIVSVYVRDRKKRIGFADQYTAFAADSAREAIDREDVDGVYICTPNTSHYEYTMLALELGKPVLCEKPATTDAELLKEMIALSRKKNVYFAEAMWTWFSPIANKVKEWFDEGEYGTLKKFDLNYHLKSINYAPRCSDPMLAGGALLDVTIYPLTYAYRILGRPETILCKGVIKEGIDTKEDIALTYPDGFVCNISASIVDMKGLEKLIIEGDKAKTKLLFFHGADQVKLKRKNGKSEVFKGDGGMLNEFDIVADEILGGLKESEYVPHEATLAVMEMMDECRKQMGLVFPFENKGE